MICSQDHWNKNWLHSTFAYLTVMNICFLINGMFLLRYKCLLYNYSDLSTRPWRLLWTKTKKIYYKYHHSCSIPKYIIFIISNSNIYYHSIVFKSLNVLIFISKWAHYIFPLLPVFWFIYKCHLLFYSCIYIYNLFENVKTILTRDPWDKSTLIKDSNNSS